MLWLAGINFVHLGVVLKNHTGFGSPDRFHAVYRTGVTMTGIVPPRRLRSR